ncbi:hypothetical protein F3J14_04275 [Burkholderia sp. Tr-862]|uniref:hypothetical protein n=1 Tax=Burkholderia sp. Tr-862 TaxID=2608331 RepID=UPI0014198DBB|nr:hypothetical protein [Burkholderia sp. Tr-862]NIF40129.1 hypothetical protein [Burkholderia sp. Tr-862]
MKRIHLATDSGGRSRCRYTSRPSTRAKFVPLADFMALPVELRCIECDKKAATATHSPAHNQDRNDGWRNGYFCAIAMLLREEGSATTVVRSLFRQGGSIDGIDSEDLALFREHGLIDDNERKA